MHLPSHLSLSFTSQRSPRGGVPGWLAALLLAALALALPEVARGQPHDTNPFTITSVVPNCADGYIALAFNAPADVNSASSEWNYVLTPEVMVIGVAVSQDGLTAWVYTDPLAQGVHYNLEVYGVYDRTGRQLTPYPFMAPVSCSSNTVAVEVPHEVGVHAGELAEFMPVVTGGGNFVFHLNPPPPPEATFDSESGQFFWPTTVADVGRSNRYHLTAMSTLPPFATTTVPVTVRVTEPLRVERITRNDSAIEIRWNSIAGRSYLVRSRRDLISDHWNDRGVMVATGDSTLWTYHPLATTSPPDLFFHVMSMPGGSCNCRTMTVDFADPDHATGASSSAVISGAAVPTATAQIKIPLWIVGTIHCSRGDGECSGTVECDISGTWELRNAAGAVIGAAGRAIKGGSANSVDGRNAVGWNVVHGKCSSEAPNDYSLQTEVKVDIDGLSGPEGRNINSGANTLRASITITVKAKCNGVTVTRTLNVVFDGRGDSGGRLGHFDDNASDYDGDGRTPGGAGAANDADNYDPSQ